MEHAPEVLDHEAEQIVRDIGIPPCPAILTKLMQEMRGDEPDFGRIGKLIGGDVSLAAAMLKTVNSPFYGLRAKATSVQQAIALLGLRNVAQLVTGLLLRQAFAGGTSDLMDEFWESSSGIAQTNLVLARKVNVIDRDGAYTFALFRDCGILAMMGAFKDYRPVLAGAKGEGAASVTDVEDQRYKMNHARIGYQLAKTWLLPDEICRAILWHHDYAALQDGRAGLPVPIVSHIALTLAAEWLYVKSAMGITSAEWRRGGAFALERLGITQAELEAFVADIAGELAAA